MKISIVFLAQAFFFTQLALAAPKVGDAAPTFEAKTHDGKTFSLKDRKAKGVDGFILLPQSRNARLHQAGVCVSRFH